MRLNILTILIHLLLSVSAAAQWTKADWKRAKSVSISNKIYSKLLVPYKHALANENKAYGYLDGYVPSQDMNMRDKLVIINLVGLDNYAEIPFPSRAARANSMIALPTWMPALLQGHYIAEIEEDSSTLFYGIDTTGIFTEATPYMHFDSLYNAYLRHNFIYYSNPQEDLDAYLESIKLKSKRKKRFNETYLLHTLQPLPQEIKSAGESKKQMFQDWAISVYATSASLKDVERRIRASKQSIIYIPNNQDLKIFSDVLESYNSLSLVYASENMMSDTATLNQADQVIIPLLSWSKELNQLIGKLSTLNDPIIIEFGKYFDNQANNLDIFSVLDHNALSEAVTAQLLNGVYNEEGFAEKLVLGLPSVYSGVDTLMITRIDSLVNYAIGNRAIPGCQILIAQDNTVLLNKAYGYYTYDSIRAVDEKSRYDLASLTKPLATTYALLKLVEENKVDLDIPLSSYLPYLQGTNKAKITTRQVLSHQAGLYPYYSFWKKAISELKVKEMDGSIQVGSKLFVEPYVSDSITAWAASSDLLAERIDTVTHEQYMYSDVGFYFLQDLIEQTVNQPLDEYLNKIYYSDLGTGLRFTPLRFYTKDEIVPTEYDVYLRNELVQGFVHDRNAALKGGVAGHSGLFGNSIDVAVMLQLQLNHGWYGGRQYFSQKVAEEFTTRHFVNNRRGLGWDMPGPEPDGPVSKYASDGSFGHTGFTGVTIWADPKENLIFVFLSNRVYPTVENNKLIEENIRTRIQDIIYEAIQAK